MNDARHGADRGDRHLLSLSQIGVGRYAQGEGEAARGVLGVVDDHTLEHDGVGDADLLAVEGEEDRGPGGQAQDDPLLIGDADEILGPERSAQAQKKARDIVLDRVAQGEAQGQAQDAGSAQKSAQDCGGVEQKQRSEGARQQDRTLNDLRQQRGQERVRRDPAVDVSRSTQQPTEQDERKEDGTRHGEHRQKSHEGTPALDDPLYGRRDPTLEAGCDRHLVGDLDHAVDLPGQPLGLGGELLRRHLAFENHHARVHPHRDRAQTVEGRVDAAEACRDRLIGLRVHLGVDPRRRACERFARLVTRLQQKPFLRQDRSAAQRGEDGKQQGGGVRNGKAPSRLCRPAALRPEAAMQQPPRQGPVPEAICHQGVKQPKHRRWVHPRRTSREDRR